MKKFLILFLVLLLTVGALSLSACSQFGKDAVGIQKIEKTGTEGLVDTYTITLTDGSTTTFTVTNGKDGENGKDGKDGVNADGTSSDPDAPTPDEYFRFTLLEDDTYEISARYVDMPPRTVIPATHEGKAVTSIRDRGFEDRRSIEEIVIPASITNIDGDAFEECDGVSIVNYKGDMASWCAITDSGRSELLYYADSLYINGSKVEGELVIPDGVTSIGEYAFYACSGITSITIPDSVTSIGRWAFGDCSGLTSVTIPSSVTSIVRNAFCGCTGLTSVSIPSSVTSIGEYVFYGCTGLTSLTIPSSVTSIGSYAFYGCTGLTSITYQGTKAQWFAIENNGVTLGTNNVSVVHCSDGDVEIKH